MLNISSRFGVFPGVGGHRSRVVRYEPFELLFTDAGAKGTQVRVITGAQDTPSVLIDRRRRERLLEDSESSAATVASSARHVKSPLSLDAPGGQAWSKRMGQALFDAVFRNGVREAFVRATAGKDGTSLRLRMPGLTRFAALPWELLCDETGNFLADSPEISIVRVANERRFRPDHKARRPLRVLVVTAVPEGCEPLAVEAELSQLRRAADQSGGLLLLETLEHATYRALRDRLSGAPVDILHFIGHGTLVQESESAALVVGDGRGGRDSLETRRLELLLAEEAPRLIVLNACHSGTVDRSDPLAGLAARLAAKGVPAVVAMREPISDPAAVTFAERFYRTLATTGSIEQAVAEARRAMVGGDSIEWSLPVLYLRPGAGIVFEPPSPWLRILRALAVGLPLSVALAIGILWLAQRTPEPLPDRAAAFPPDLKPPPPGVQLCEAPPSLGLQLVHIEPGRFTMGRSTGGDSNERPAHDVELTKPFCMSRTEVTEELWSRLLRAKPGSLPYLPKRVSWEEADEFASKLTELYPGYVFRLPTEAEWEYAARAGSPSPFAFDVSLLPKHGNCKDTEDGMPGLARVGSYEQNAWGLYDMHGNVFEWVSDWYEDDYPSEPDKDPKGPTTGERRIRRGGNYMSAPDSCSATARSNVQGGRQQQATGFRLVMEPPASVPGPSPAP